MSVKPLLAGVCLTLLMSAVTRADGAQDVDPFEGINRSIFEINSSLDSYVTRPLSKGYRYVAPLPVERGVSNFFSNLTDFNALLNALLQGELAGAGRAGKRFFINTTLGLGGLFDPATRAGIAPHRADFGQTLAKWGMSRGPYLVLPFMGPRSVRSGLGTLVDVNAAPQNYLTDISTRNWLYVVSTVNDRAALLDAEQLISGDRYIFVRDAYLQQREAFVNGGNTQDSFSDFGAEDDWAEEF